MRRLGPPVIRWQEITRRHRGAHGLRGPAGGVCCRHGWSFERLETRMLLSVGQPPDMPKPDLWPIAAGIALCPETTSSGRWLDLNLQDAFGAGQKACVTLLQSTPQQITGQVTVGGAWLESVAVGGSDFVRLSIPGCGYTDAIGQPQLPVIRELLAVPHQAMLHVEAAGEARTVSLAQLGVDVPMVPLQAPVPKSLDPGEQPLVLDQDAYHVDAFGPAAPVVLSEAGYFAGQRLVILQIAPVRYNPVAGAISVYDTLTFEIHIDGGQPGPPVLSNQTAATLEDFVLDAPGTQGDKSGRLLIIAHDSLEAGLAGFLAHKASLGWTVDLVNTSTAGTTTTAIKSYIVGRYNNISTRPDALLLVGDTAQIPCFTGVGEDDPDTDLYYACTDPGDDWMPEFPVGRFSVTNTTELAAIVNKTIAYETAPGGQWMSRATFMASEDNYTVTEGTHNYCISTYMDPRGYTSDRLYTYTYNATTQQVRDALNAGRALAIYSGHGSDYSWADGPPFSQNDVRNLANAGMYPFVTSFACLTGHFSLSECFAETWIRQANKGAVDVLASSVTSYWTEDDILQKKLFSAIYDEGRADFGSAILRAKQMYLEYFGASNPTTRRYFEMYNLFGDPTVQLQGLEFAISSPSDLPTAYRDEPYQYTLTAHSGALPYTWSVAAGALPAGLSLNPATGVISGTPTALGTSTFTVQVEDAADQTASKEFHLAVVDRLEITTPATLPPATRNLPYSVTFEARGGTTPYTWAMLDTGGYVESTPSSGWLGGGTAMGWHADDAYWTLNLPWDFPFYRTPENTVYVSSNGFINFGSGSSDYSNSTEELIASRRIAPLWDDLRTDRTGGDIFVTQTADYVAIRWAAQRYSTAEPVNVEAVLYRDGDIRFNYGAAHSGLSPTIGVSAGDGAAYTLSVRDGAASIPAYVSSLLEYSVPLPAGLAWDADAHTVSGTPTVAGTFQFHVGVQDASTPPQSASGEFTLQVSTLPPLSLVFAADATEGDGVLAGTVSIPEALAADLQVTLASSDTSEVTVSSPVTIYAGFTSASISLAIIDDPDLDGLQTATITASATGYLPAQRAIRIHDNESSSLTVELPPEAAEGAQVEGWVRTGVAPTADLWVALSSSDPTEATVPAGVTIPAGQTAAPFVLTARTDHLIDGTQSALITAHMENWTDGQATIDILDTNATLTLDLPAKTWESQETDLGRVVLGGLSEQDVVVALASDDETELVVPSPVIVRAGQLAAVFEFFVEDDADQDGAQLVHVTATAAGFAPGEGTIIVGDNELHHYAFAPIASPQLGAEPFEVVVEAVDVNGQRIEVFNGAFDLTAASDQGSLPISIYAKDSQRGGGSAAGVPYDKLALTEAPAKGLGVYHDYAALTAELLAYASNHSDLCQLLSIGQSVQSRELWAVKISDHPAVEEDEPEVKYVGAIHGDESVGTEMCLYLVDYLLNHYGSDPRVTAMVDQMEIWIVPMMNPDGAEALSRENANGVDLNRNFPEGAWTPIGNIFDGPAMDTSGREPEVMAMMQWSAGQSFTLSANFHTGSLVVNYPYDNDGLGDVDSPTPDDALFEHISEEYSSHNLPMWNSPVFYHGITNGAAWYSISGGMQDWNYRYLSCNEVTIELSNEFRPPERQLASYWEDNRESMLSYLETVHLGVRGVVSDAMTGEPVYAKVLVSGNSHPVFTDPEVGDYHRMLLPGTYSLTFTAPGYYSRTIDGVVVTDEGTTRLDVALAPASGGPMMIGGRWIGMISVDALGTNVVLTAQDAQHFSGTSNLFDVVCGPLDHFRFDPVASPQHLDTSFPVTVTAVDAHGFPVADFVGPVRLKGIAGSSAEPVQIGHGTTPLEYPLDAYWEDCRTQVIYLQSEIGGACTITGLALDVTWTPGQPLDNWTIRMKHTSLSQYVSPSWECCGWTTVYQADATIDSTGWVTFTFDTPFVYNGFDNLLVDFSFNNDYWTEEGYVNGTDTGVVRTITYSTDSHYGDPLTWEGTTPEPEAPSFIPNVRLISQTPVAIAPEVTGQFDRGVWTGDVMVLEEVEEMILVADDGAGHAGQTNPFAVTAALGWDFGDAPDPSYPTLLASDGARHVLGGLYLGSRIDPEADGQPGQTAQGDDLARQADEDGVLFELPLVAGLSVPIQVTASQAGRLDAWIDLNRDGDWLDVGEQVLVSASVGAGLSTLRLAIPADATAGPTYLRFRLSSSGGLEPTGESPDGEVEDYLKEILPSTLVDLRPTGFEALPARDLSGGELWYRLIAGANNLLSADASYNPAFGPCGLAWYDPLGTPLGVSDVGGGRERLDRPGVASGEVFFVRLDGANPDVQLVFCQLLNVRETRVTVQGTAEADTFVFDASVARFIAIRGVAYDFEAARVTSVSFDGGLGDDTATLVGSPEDDLVRLRPTSATMSGPGYTVAVASVVAVEATAGGGAADLAYLYGSYGDDEFRGRPGEASMAGNGFTLRALGFDRVYGYAQAGTDVAILADSLGDDLFCARTTSATLAGEGFYLYVSRFDEVRAIATGGVSDVARLYDSSGDDIFIGRPEEATLTGDGFKYVALAFDRTYAYARYGGVDKAELYDGPGNDNFTAHPTYATLSGPDFFNQALGFEEVKAFAINGGSNGARMYDSSGDDTFEARQIETMMSGPGYRNVAVRFRSVYGYAFRDGHDVAHLYDTLGNDVFSSRPAYAQIVGLYYTRLARAFDEVYGHASDGYDVAELRDSAGDDHLLAQENWAQLHDAALAYYDKVIGFDRVVARASEGSPGSINRKRLIPPLAFVLWTTGPWIDG